MTGPTVKTFFLRLLLLVIGLSLTALSTTDALSADKKKQAAPAPAQQPQAQAAAQDPGYIIGIEDVLEIDVWKNPDLSKVVAVRPDGMISLPLIGDLKAAGLTPGQLREELNSRLKEYQDPVITSVIVQEVRSYRIFVLGEVLNPGTYTVSRQTTVLQAIAMAGGMSQFASNNVILVREKNGSEAEKIRIRFSEIVDEDAKKDKNMVLMPGDTIFVR